MLQISLNLTHLPLSIVFLADGTISIVPRGNFATIIDGDVVIDSIGVSIGRVQYEYRRAIDYKDDKKFLKWLQSLGLDQPSRDAVYNALQAQEMQMRGFPQGFGFNF